jgi:hypothetical protein
VEHRRSPCLSWYLWVKTQTPLEWAVTAFTSLSSWRHRLGVDDYLREYWRLRGLASPAKAEEAGATAPDGGGSWGGGLGKRYDDLAPRGWLVRRCAPFSIFFIFLFVSERNFVRAAYHLYKALYGFPSTNTSKARYLLNLSKKIKIRHSAEDLRASKSKTHGKVFFYRGKSYSVLLSCICTRYKVYRVLNRIFRVLFIHGKDCSSGSDDVLDLSILAKCSRVAVK